MGLVRIARGAQRDGLDIAMLTKLADLGSGSGGFDNVLRDFRNKILEPNGIKELVTGLTGRFFKCCVLPSTVL